MSLGSNVSKALKTFLALSSRESTGGLASLMVEEGAEPSEIDDTLVVATLCMVKCSRGWIWLIKPDQEALVLLYREFLTPTYQQSTADTALYVSQHLG